MIKATAANGKDRCDTCRKQQAAINIELGNKDFCSLFHLCRSCAQTLMDNLERKEAPTHAHTD